MTAPAVERTRAHLAVVFGPKEANRLVEECLREAGLEEATDAGQLHRLGTVFVKRGGFLEVVGRFLRVQAISLECPGAQEVP
ncbi:MAG TPA: hypothetical protein VFF73_07890 [Planctomycetota bacterium]|jgi:hypothetical protein|nr:hypothetical protein [Planctomycetota bacterium]